MAFVIYIGVTFILMVAAALSKTTIEIDDTTWIILAILSAAEAIRMEVKK